MDEATVENKQIIFKGYIQGTPQETDMEFVSEKKIKPVAPKGSGAFLVKNLYLSCDPYMRGRMRYYRGSYIPPFVPGEVIEGFGVAEVISSDNPEFKTGDIVSGFTGWEEYTLIYSNKTQQLRKVIEGFGVVEVISSDNPEFKTGDIVSGFTVWEEYTLIYSNKTQQLRKVHQDDEIPLSYHIGLLGMPGFTAYAGLYEVCGPLKENDCVSVSAASGAVGQLVGQLAKLNKCYVVGSAGTSHKVDLLKNKLGFDEAFNYKEESDLDAALKRYFPQGIDVYFDNVGGDMLSAVLLNMKVHGKIGVCGMVSQQSLSDELQGIKNMYNVVIKRLKIQGFLQSDYLHLFPKFVEDVTQLYKQGKIIYVEDVSEGLESAPRAFAGLFSGKNVGKQVIRVAPV